jgi:hypothetical protein
MAGFDPTQSVRFDLPRGSVTVAAGAEERHVLLPCAALDDLVLIAGTEAAVAVGRAMGATIGKRVAARLGGAAGARASSIEQVVRDMAGEMATLGLGVASVEKWGRALVVAVEGAAVSDQPFLASIVEGMLVGASDANVSCTSLGRDGGVVRILAASEAGIGRARAMLDQGATWGDVLARLQRKGAGA